VRDKDRREFFPNRGDTGAKCRDFALANGLILRATKDTMLFSPPLVIDRSQIDEMIQLTRLSLDETAQHLGVA
jgi:putrescine aminotransferase